MTEDTVVALGQPTHASHHSANLARLISFADTAVALPERRSGHLRPKFDENAASTVMLTRTRPELPPKDGNCHAPRPMLATELLLVPNRSAILQEALSASACSADLPP